VTQGDIISKLTSREQSHDDAIIARTYFKGLAMRSTASTPFSAVARPTSRLALSGYNTW